MINTKYYYCLLLYNDIHQSKINGIFLFEKIKNISIFTNGLLKYSDVKNKHKKYKTYKNFFKIIKFQS